MQKKARDIRREVWVCPECESDMVTPFEYMHDGVTMDRLIRAEDGDVFEDAHVCWSCGWMQKVRVTVEHI